MNKSDAPVEGPWDGLPEESLLLRGSTILAIALLGFVAIALAICWFSEEVPPIVHRTKDYPGFHLYLESCWLALLLSVTLSMATALLGPTWMRLVLALLSIGAILLFFEWWVGFRTY